jgi:elongation factor P--beta-lysine ligase
MERPTAQACSPWASSTNISNSSDMKPILSRVTLLNAVRKFALRFGAVEIPTSQASQYEDTSRLFGRFRVDLLTSIDFDWVYR